jgi:hypothetical protein
MTYFKEKVFYLLEGPFAGKMAQVVRKSLFKNVLRYCYFFQNCLKLCILEIYWCLIVLDGKGLYQPSCHEEWKKCKKERRKVMPM